MQVSSILDKNRFSGLSSVYLWLPAVQTVPSQGLVGALGRLYQLSHASGELFLKLLPQTGQGCQGWFQKPVSWVEWKSFLASRPSQTL